MSRSHPKLKKRQASDFRIPATLAVLALIFGSLFSSAQNSAGSSTPLTPQFDGPAELPRLSVASSTASTPAPGRTRDVHSGDNLKSILAEAHCGDKIELQAGASFQGTFVLPAKPCDDQHWIVLRSSAPDNALPTEGERITPCYAGVQSLPGRPAFPCGSPHNAMARLIATRGEAALRLADGANHYRIGPGLELTRADGDGVHFGLVGPRQGGSKGINHVVIDRDWIHGTATDETVRGVFLGGFTYAAVVDSYINDFHCTAGVGACVDSQAIAGGVGKIPEGPWKIENNFLEAGAENILFGGGGGTTVPADITIRRNYLFKPLTWMPGQPGFIGGLNNNDPKKCAQFNTPGYCPFIVKNLFELKNAERLLFEGNVLENSWPGFSQRGSSIALQVMSEGGNANATVADITIRYNGVAHTANGITLKAPPSNAVAQPKLLARISIHDDLFDDIGPAYNNGTTNAVQVAFQIGRCPSCAPLHEIKIDHVTMIVQRPQNFMILGAPLSDPIAHFIFTNNIVSVPEKQAITGTGPKAPCAFSGSTNAQRWEHCTVDGAFAHNILIGATGDWPRENFLVNNLDEAGFVNPNGGRGGNYHLATSGRHRRVAANGKYPGADIDAVQRATQGVTLQP